LFFIFAGIKKIIKKYTSAMKKRIYIVVIAMLLGILNMQAIECDTVVKVDNGKAIYIPKDLRKIDLQKNDSVWSFKRMRLSPNFVIFWQKGFGDDLSNAPDLDGHQMKVDLDNLVNRLEFDYKTFCDTMKFVKAGSKSEKYRMMVMLNYSLEGTAYGGDYDGQIGALWIAPNRIQDKKLNCIAHELGHCFQSQISCDGQGVGWGGSGFFEMTSQWMLWNVNPDWVKDEQYHWDAFKKLTHKPFLDMENIYHSPYIIEYWSEKHGMSFIAEMFRRGKVGEDPVMTYKEMTRMTQQQYCDEMFDACRRIVNFDFKYAYNETRDYANHFDNFMPASDKDGWQAIPKVQAPGECGFNIIPLMVPKKRVTVDFEGMPNDSDSEIAGWRYGMVAVTTDGKAIYGDMQRDKVGTFTYLLPKDSKIANLWLVVMGAPLQHHRLDVNAPQYPYRIRIK
jgi:hypothetical protein